MSSAPAASLAEAEAEFARLIARDPPGSDARLAAARRRADLRPDPFASLDAAAEAIHGFRFREAHIALELALARAPDCLPARWLQMQYPLDPSPASAAEQQAFSARWREGLRWFESQDYRKPELAAQVWGCVGSSTPFYLHYLEDAIPEMRRYGRLVARMMGALAPALPPRPLRSGRRRIVFVGTHLREHTVTRLFLPLIEGLDRQRFDVHILDTLPGPPDWQARVAAAGTRHAGPRAAPQWRQLLAELAPDVIVYLEIGMHPLNQGLAALRLAPVQACLWGHPVTCGLPTIDYALVPDALEPANAQDHYHERLMRLPGLGHGLSPSPMRAADQAPFAPRGEGALEILCAQAAFKLLPAQDAVFAQILRTLPQARLHLTPLVPAHAQQALAERMRSAFTRHEVDFDTRVQMHPLLPLEQFQALAAACDFGIDTIGWSGGMTALDLLPQGLPIVAAEGPTMRSRQTAALLKWLDVPELVARDGEDMVRVAARLGADTQLPARLRSDLRERAPRLSAQGDTQAALAEFLASVQVR
jgi:protein O-GlcNAc transferase